MEGHWTRGNLKPWKSDGAFSDKEIHSEANKGQSDTKEKKRRPLNDLLWLYKDPQGDIQGPFNDLQMTEWFEAGYFSQSLLVKRAYQDKFVPLGTLMDKDKTTSPFYTSPDEIMRFDDSEYFGEAGALEGELEPLEPTKEEDDDESSNIEADIPSMSFIKEEINQPLPAKVGSDSQKVEKPSKPIDVSEPKAPFVDAQPKTRQYKKFYFFFAFTIPCR
jgi:hypothetical protein